MKNKVFLVFNTACFGDVLLCNTLCQNIKLIYPDSKIVFIVDKPYIEAAKYQKDVDDVVIFDKKGEHKGLWGIMKFIYNFKYKNSYASFLTYSNVRNYIISILSFTKHVIGLKNKSKETLNQKRHADLLKALTSQEIKNLPIKYEVSGEIPEHLSQFLNKNDKYIVINPITKREVKNIPINTVIELIQLLNNSKYKVILCGTGDVALSYAEAISKTNYNFINLVEKTSIKDIANILQNSVALISADTGTMHLGCAIGVFTLAVFYEEQTIKTWAPRKEIYNCELIKENQTPENIYNSLMKHLNNE